MSGTLSRLDLRQSKVLLVDDNVQSLDILLKVMMGFRAQAIKPCTSAQEATLAFQAQSFDLIIIDGEMPGEDGLALTRRLRSDPKHPNHCAPVVIVSAHTSHEKIMRVRDAGANIVVKKPIAPAVLLHRIEWLARNKRSFVTSEGYCGPDRRFKIGPPPPGVDERRAEALSLLSGAPERAMSQDDIDSLFG